MEKCVLCQRITCTINISIKEFLEYNKKYITNEIELAEYDNSVVIIGVN